MLHGRLVLAITASVLATSGFVDPKWLGPIAFAGLSSLMLISLRQFSRELALWTTVAIAFLNAAWLANVLRQFVFEVSTVGHLTQKVDSCAASLLPITVGILMLTALFGTRSENVRVSMR